MKLFLNGHFTGNEIVTSKRKCLKSADAQQLQCLQSWSNVVVFQRLLSPQSKEHCALAHDTEDALSCFDLATYNSTIFSLQWLSVIIRWGVGEQDRVSAVAMRSEQFSVIIIFTVKIIFFLTINTKYYYNVITLTGALIPESHQSSYIYLSVFMYFFKNKLQLQSQIII